MKSFLKLEAGSGEELVGNISTEAGIIRILDDLFNSLTKKSAVEVHIYRHYVLIGTRDKGHGDKMVMKFTNFGFCPDSRGSKSDSLVSAIRSIDDGNLPEYCYRAITGDVDALRQTTAHLVRAYDAKIRRMLEKAKSLSEIEVFTSKRDMAMRRLELDDKDLLEISEPIIIEIPKDPEYFYEEDEVAIGGSEN